MSFSPKQYALAIPKTLNSLKSLILIEKILKISHIYKASDVDEIFSDNINNNLSNLIKMLLEEKRLKFFNKIFIEFKRLLEKEKIAITGSITTPQPITNEDTIKTENSLEKYFGMPVILEKIEDPSLIGGTIIKVGDWRIDNSFLTKLKTLNSDNRRLNVEDRS